MSVWDRMDANPWGVAVQKTIEALFPDNPPQFFKVPFNFADRDLFWSALNANGFDQITMSTVSMEYRSSSARDLARGMIQGSPLRAEIADRGGSSELIVDAVAEAYSRFGGDSPFRTEMQAIVVTARAGE